MDEALVAIILAMGHRHRSASSVRLMDVCALAPGGKIEKVAEAPLVTFPPKHL